MKKLTKVMSVLLVFTLLASVVSCGHDTTVSDIDSSVQGTSAQSTPQETKEPILPSTGEIEYPPAAEKPIKNYGVTLTAKKVSATGATLTFYQEDVRLSGKLSSPEWYAIEVYVTDTAYSGHWERIDPRVRPAVMMPAEEYYGCAAYEITEQNATRYSVDWSEMYGELPPGGYRIVKILRENAADGSVNDNYYYALFRVEDEKFAGYGLTLADVPVDQMPYASPLVEYDLRMTAEEVTPRGATLRFSHATSGGYGYFLERFDGENWQAVPYLPINMVEAAFPAVAISIRETMAVCWVSRYGELDAGVYRISKDLDSWERHAKYYAYFEITE